MAYKHFDIITAQSAKRPGDVCGDVLSWRRDATATTAVLADGIGSGIRANVAATLCVSRLMALIKGGTSLRHAFGELVRTMEGNRDPALPFAAFTAARVLNDGQATVLSYETPGTMLINGRHATALTQRTLTMGAALVGEASCYLEPGEGLLLVSDGITQSGLGRGLANGWGLEAAAQFTSDRLLEGRQLAEVPQTVHEQARRHWGPDRGDDCTAALLACRLGNTINILTGPPSSREHDAEVVSAFLAAEGLKVVCGATTANIVARCLGRKVDIEQDPRSLVAPPRYSIPGIDLVTEGAVTLTQVYNVIDESPDHHEEDSGVADLCGLLWTADRVNITVGVAANPANGAMSFRQQGILPRATIIPLLCQKLETAGKLVLVHHV
ncbi:MAG: SpoIIE family protein phosphatase [Planctomycetes bacterium]|nr:SpoIIE family protein phosphatase [Planctomycetota bacterium]